MLYFRTVYISSVPPSRDEFTRILTLCLQSNAYLTSLVPGTPAVVTPSDCSYVTTWISDTTVLSSPNGHQIAVICRGHDDHQNFINRCEIWTPRATIINLSAACVAAAYKSNAQVENSRKEWESPVTVFDLVRFGHFFPGYFDLVIVAADRDIARGDFLCS